LLRILLLFEGIRFIANSANCLFWAYLLLLTMPKLILIPIAAESAKNVKQNQLIFHCPVLFCPKKNVPLFSMPSLIKTTIEYVHFFIL
uniref:Secreted protein n=1 Tax=Panagrolaimus sp. JU765 TaxID=591449 RepID=A0AC34R071_9BILA